MTNKSSKAEKRKKQCWIVTNGKNFECKCYVKWCTNVINPFDFHVGTESCKENIARTNWNKK